MATENLLDELGGKGFYAKAAGLAQKAVKDQNGAVIDTTYATKAELPTVDQTYNASSTNAQSGVAVAAAIAGTGQVPSVQQSDDGKVLKAIWDTSVTPAVGSFRWDAAPSGVPSTTSSDEGKVLGVTNSTGSLGWVAQTPAQVNADWNAASGSVAEILNKPSIPTVNDSTVTVKIGSTTVDTFTTNQSSASDIVIPEATDSVAGAMTSTDKRKLNGIESGAQVNVKPDWNAASGADAEILNKPTIPTVDQTYDGTSTNAQSGTAVASALSGLSFDEVPQVGSGDDGKVLKASYSGGAGSYSWDTDSGEANVIEAITVNSESTTISSKTVNIPAVTASTSGVGGTSGVMTPSDKEKLDGLVSNVQSDWNAASGTAAEILNKPTIPTVDQTYSSSSTNAQSGVAVASAISGIADVPQVGSGDDGKVLKASYSGGAGSYSWQPESGGGATYTAGDGIAIDQSNNISVKIPTSSAGLAFDGNGVLDVKTSTAKGIQKGASGLEVRLANSSGLELSSGLKVKTDGTSIQVNSSGELEAMGGGGSTYTAGDGIDISAQDVISVKTDGSTIQTNADGELEVIGGGGGGEVNVIEGVKLDGAASVLTPDASKNVTIPNAVATGETGATNGLMTADDKKALGTAVQYKVNPLESGTPVLLAQQLYVVESDAQIISIAGQSSEIQGKGTIFFRVGV